MMTKWRITKSCRTLRGLDVHLCHVPGVPPTLHPRLYADARIRGLRLRRRLLHLFLKGHQRRPKVKPSPRDEENDKALNRRASLNSRSTAEESNLKITDKVTES
jgi:hypothetical protein